MTYENLPRPVLDLLEHLATTGTGQSKLDAIAQLALKCEDGNEFLDRVHKVVPPGTLEKIKSFVETTWESQQTVTEPAPEEPGPPETVEARDHERDEILKKNPG